MTSLTSSHDLFDLAREKHNHLGFAVYAYTPGGAVTLELHVGDILYKFEAQTLGECLKQAFGEPEVRPEEPDIFA